MENRNQSFNFGKIIERAIRIKPFSSQESSAICDDLKNIHFPEYSKEITDKIKNCKHYDDVMRELQTIGFKFNYSGVLSKIANNKINLKQEFTSAFSFLTAISCMCNDDECKDIDYVGNIFNALCNLFASEEFAEDAKQLFKNLIWSIHNRKKLVTTQKIVSCAICAFDFLGEKDCYEIAKIIIEDFHKMDDYSNTKEWKDLITTLKRKDFIVNMNIVILDSDFFGFDKGVAEIIGKILFGDKSDKFDCYCKSFLGAIYNTIKIDNKGEAKISKPKPVNLNKDLGEMIKKLKLFPISSTFPEGYKDNVPSNFDDEMFDYKENEKVKEAEYAFAAAIGEKIEAFLDFVNDCINENQYDATLIVHFINMYHNIYSKIKKNEIRNILLKKFYTLPIFGDTYDCTVFSKTEDFHIVSALRTYGLNKFGYTDELFVHLASMLEFPNYCSDILLRLKKSNKWNCNCKSGEFVKKMEAFSYYFKNEEYSTLKLITIDAIKLNFKEACNNDNRFIGQFMEMTYERCMRDKVLECIKGYEFNNSTLTNFANFLYPQLLSICNRDFEESSSYEEIEQLIISIYNEYSKIISGDYMKMLAESNDMIGFIKESIFDSIAYLANKQCSKELVYLCLDILVKIDDSDLVDSNKTRLLSSLVSILGKTFDCEYDEQLINKLHVKTDINDAAKKGKPRIYLIIFVALFKAFVDKEQTFSFLYDYTKSLCNDTEDIKFIETVDFDSFLIDEIKKYRGDKEFNDSHAEHFTRLLELFSTISAKAVSQKALNKFISLLSPIKDETLSVYEPLYINCLRNIVRAVYKAANCSTIIGSSEYPIIKSRFQNSISFVFWIKPNRIDDEKVNILRISVDDNYIDVSIKGNQIEYEQLSDSVKSDIIFPYEINKKEWNLVLINVQHIDDKQSSLKCRTNLISRYKNYLIPRIELNGKEVTIKINDRTDNAKDVEIELGDVIIDRTITDDHLFNKCISCSPLEQHKTSILTRSVMYKGHDFVSALFKWNLDPILPLFSIQSLNMLDVCDIFIDIISIAINIGVELQLNAIIANLSFLLNNYSSDNKHLTFDFYKKLFNLFMIAKSHRKQILEDLLCSFSIWKLSKDEEREKIIKHLDSVVFKYFIDDVKKCFTFNKFYNMIKLEFASFKEIMIMLRTISELSFDKEDYYILISDIYMNCSKRNEFSNFVCSVLSNVSKKVSKDQCAFVGNLIETGDFNAIMFACGIASNIEASSVVFESFMFKFNKKFITNELMTEIFKQSMNDVNIVPLSFWCASFVDQETQKKFVERDLGNILLSKSYTETVVTLPVWICFFIEHTDSQNGAGTLNLMHKFYSLKEILFALSFTVSEWTKQLSDTVYNFVIECVAEKNFAQFDAVVFYVFFLGRFDEQKMIDHVNEKKHSPDSEDELIDIFSRKNAYLCNFKSIGENFDRDLIKDILSHVDAGNNISDEHHLLKFYEKSGKSKDKESKKFKDVFSKIHKECMSKYSALNEHFSEICKCSKKIFNKQELDAAHEKSASSAQQYALDYKLREDERKAKWSQLYSSLSVPGGPWGVDLSDDSQVHWKRSSKMCAGLYPTMMRQNRNFVMHHGYSEPKVKNFKNVDKEIDSDAKNSAGANSLYEYECKIIKPAKTHKAFLFIFNDRITLLYSDKNKIIQKSSIRHIYLRTIIHVQTAIEIITTNSSIFIDFAPVKGTAKIAEQISNGCTKLINVQKKPFMQDFENTNFTEDWRNNRISNFEYLIHLNICSGRSFNCIAQYPIFPWILKDYRSDITTTANESVYRDLSVPIGAMNDEKFQGLRENYDQGLSDCFYGSGPVSHLSVCAFLVRMEPFSTGQIIIQGGRFDDPGRQFASYEKTFRVFEGTVHEYWELIPDHFFMPEILLNENHFPIGNERCPVNDVILPPWSKSAPDFIYKHRKFLESKYVSEHLNSWIDLVWGYKQRGKEAYDAKNIFLPDLYDDIWSKEESKDNYDMIASYLQFSGQIPPQLFKIAHPVKEECQSKPILQKWEMYYNFKAQRNAIAMVMDETQKRMTFTVLFEDGSIKRLQEYSPNDIREIKSLKTNINLQGKHYLIASSTNMFLVYLDMELKYTLFIDKIVGSIKNDNVTSLAISEQLVCIGRRDSITEFLSFPDLRTQSAISSYRESIVCVAVSRNFDVVVNATKDGAIFIISLSTRRTIKVINIPGEPKNIVITPGWGFIIVSAVRKDKGEEKCVYAFTINGMFIRDMKTEKMMIEKMRSWTTPRGFDYIVAIGGNKVFVCEAYFLNFKEIYLQSSAIEAFYSKSAESIFALTKSSIVKIHYVPDDLTLDGEK